MSENDQNNSPFPHLANVAPMTLTSSDLLDGGSLERPQWSGVFGAGGEDKSPQLSWAGAPAETRSFAIMCYDPDAPTGSGYWHWAVANIPADVTSLPSGAGTPDSGEVPASAITLKDDAGIRGFLGAAPPPGHGRHRYVFLAHAVDVESLDITEDTSPAMLGFHLAGHTIALGVLTGFHEQ